MSFWNAVNKTKQQARMNMAKNEPSAPVREEDRPSCFICGTKTDAVHSHPYGHTCDPGNIDGRPRCFIVQRLFKKKHTMTAEEMENDSLDVNSGITEALLNMLPHTRSGNFPAAKILFDHLKAYPESVPEPFSTHEGDLSEVILYYTAPGDDELSLSFAMDSIQACIPPRIAEGSYAVRRNEAYDRRVKLMRHVGQFFEPEHRRLPAQNSRSTDVFYMPRLLPEGFTNAGVLSERYSHISDGVFYDYAIVALYKIRAALALRNIENLELVLLKAKLPRLPSELALEMQRFLYTPCMRNNAEFQRDLIGGGRIRPWVNRLEREIQAIFDSLSRHRVSFWNSIFNRPPYWRRRQQAIPHEISLARWSQAPDVDLWTRGRFNHGTNFRYAHDDCPYYPEIMIWMKDYVNCSVYGRPITYHDSTWGTWLSLAIDRVSLADDDLRYPQQGTASVLQALENGYERFHPSWENKSIFRW